MPIHMSGNVRLACRSACQSMCQAYASKYASACLGTSASHYCMSWRMPRNMFVWLVVWNFFYFFHILGLIILTDFNIFRRVFSTTNHIIYIYTYYTCIPINQNAIPSCSLGGSVRPFIPWLTWHALAWQARCLKLWKPSPLSPNVPSLTAQGLGYGNIPDDGHSGEICDDKEGASGMLCLITWWAWEI